MSKVIDITSKLTNDRPTIKLAEDKIFEVDDRKNTVIEMNKKLESADLNDLEELDNILEILLGKKAVKEIDEMNLSFSSYQSILIATMASVAGESFGVAEARFRKATEEI